VAELQLLAAWSFDSNGDVEPWLSRGREAGKTTTMAASVERHDAAMVASMEKKWGEGVVLPDLRHEKWSVPWNLFYFDQYSFHVPDAKRRMG
jgi:hypothetical protein